MFFFVLLPVSLNCPFFIAPSVFSNVYFAKSTKRSLTCRKHGTRSHFPLHNLTAPIKRTSPNRYILWGLSLGNRYQYPVKKTLIIMTKLRHLCLFVYCGVQHILCCVFALFFFVYVARFSGLSIFEYPFWYLSQTACLQSKNNTLYYFAWHVCNTYKDIEFTLSRSRTLVRVVKYVTLKINI